MFWDSFLAERDRQSYQRCCVMSTASITNDFPTASPAGSNFAAPPTQQAPPQSASRSFCDNQVPNASTSCDTPPPATSTTANVVAEPASGAPSTVMYACLHERSTSVSGHGEHACSVRGKHAHWPSPRTSPGQHTIKANRVWILSREIRHCRNE